MNSMRVFSYLAFAILLEVVLLLWFMSSISISYKEALVFFEHSEISYYLAKFGIYLFGQNDFGLRILFMLLHIANVILVFLLSRLHLRRELDSVACAVLFMMLPGINAGALLLSNVNIILFFTLLLCFLHEKYGKIPYWLLTIMVFVDDSFALVFLALIFYAISCRDTVLLVVSVIFFAINSYIYGLDIGGRPSGYFVDTMGHLLLIFSPFVFLYFLYSLYRYFNIEKRPISFYIAITSLFFMLFLSLRQRVDTQSYAPLLLCFLPLCFSIYISGLRVRLPQFRARYKIPFMIAFTILLLFTCSVFLSKILFLVVPYNDNFALRHYIAKELAYNLKARGIDSVSTGSHMQARLKFYGIGYGDRYLSDTKIEDSRSIPIVYYGKEITKFYIK